jgi:cytochrome b561
MKNRTVILLWLDCAMLLAVVLLECLSLTGLQLHEWLGFLLCPLVLLHVVLQWQWFITQFQRVLTPGARRVRVNAGLNLLLLIFMAAVLISGGLVSNQSVATFGERFGRLRVWSEIHGGLNFILVVLVGLHLALNWDWIVAALRRWCYPHGGATRTGQSTQPQPGLVDSGPDNPLTLTLSPSDGEREARSGATSSSSPHNARWLRWPGRATAVLAVTFIIAGGIYFAMAGLTPRSQEQEESGPAPNFRPQGRPQSFRDGTRELGVTAATVAIAALVGRYLFRLRL